MRPDGRNPRREVIGYWLSVIGEEGESLVDQDYEYDYDYTGH